MMELLIKLGGIFYFICAVFHIFFPGMYQWKAKLSSLQQEDAAKVLNSLRLMNACQLLVWLMFACITFFYSHELLSSKLGTGILFMIVLFWIIRIGVLQPLFVGFKTILSKLQVVFFSVGLALFIIPLIDALWKNLW